MRSAESSAHGLFVIACVRVKRHGAHAERRKAVVGERIQDEHRADEQIPLVAPFVAVHEVSDDEQHDAVIREVQRAHAGEARGNLDGEAQPVHRARQRILPIEVPGRPKQDKRHERQRQPPRAGDSGTAGKFSRNARAPMDVMIFCCVTLMKPARRNTTSAL